MKHIYLKSLFAALLLLCSTVATAHDFEVGGIYYDITSLTAKTVGVAYKGSSSGAYSNEYSGRVSIPSTVRYSGTTYSVTSISDAAFYNCINLTSVTIPNSVTSIGGGAFSFCHGLTSVTIGSGVTSIGSSAFYSCTGLTSVTIPNSVTSIGSSAFSSCHDLTSVTIGSGVTSIGSYAFENCTDLNSLTIPNSVTSISDAAFSSCHGLTSVTIGSGVTSIGYEAFRECTGLTCIEIPNSVTSIGGSAFSDCTGLTDIVIPNSVKNIGDYAFKGTSLMNLVVLSSTPPNISKNAFSNTSNITLYIPYGSSTAYKLATAWSKFANYVEFNQPNNPAHQPVKLYMPDIIGAISRWECSRDDGANWTNIECTEYCYTETEPERGEVLYRALKTDGTYGDILTINYYDPVPEVIATAPANETKTVDESVTFTLNVLDDGYTYQWMHNDNAIEGATKNTYSISAIKMKDAGKYYCVVSNPVSSINSSTSTIVVSKCPQVITFPEIETKTYGDLPFTLPTTTDKGLSISYQSTNTNVATIEGNTVTIVGAGTTDIIANQQGDEHHYAAAPVSRSFTVNRQAQSITFNPFGNVVYGDAQIELNQFTNKNLKITYISSNTDVATVDGNIITIVKPGVTTIKATQNGNKNYSSAQSIERTLIVNKAEQKIEWYELATKNYGDEDFALPKTTDKGLSISYTSDNERVATINGNIVSIKNAGVANITATQSGDDYYNAATSVTQTLTVSKIAQVITFNELPVVTFGDESIELNAIVSSSKEVFFESSDEAVATISGNILTIVGSGSCIITASCAGDNNYYTATPVERELVVNKAKQIIKISPIEEKTYGDEPFEFEIATNNNQPVILTSSNASVLTINGRTATIRGAGEVTITALQKGSTNYEKAETQTNVVINKATLTAKTFNATRLYGDKNPQFNIAFSGFVNDETKEDLDVIPVAISSATELSNVGEYDITINRVVDKNYVFDIKNAKLTIEKALITVEPSNMSKTYGEKNPIIPITYNGFKNNDNENVLLSKAVAFTKAKTMSNVGEYIITVEGANAINYDFEYKEGFLIIQKAPLTVSVEDVESVYGAEHEHQIKYEGFKGNDDISVLDVVPNIVCDVNQKTPAGTYKMAVTGGEDNNYDIIYSYDDGRNYAIINIEKAPLVITAEDKSINYMEAVPQFTMSYDGFVNNEDESVLDELPQIICDATGETLPGTYEIILDGGYDNNYEYILINGRITIVDTTSINAIELDLEENAVYNLNGMRITDIENLTRGIYIINGKKVFIR